MIRALLIGWAALASIVMLVAGVVLVVWRFGTPAPGLLFSLLAAGLLYTSWCLAREEWGWRRRVRRARQAVPGSGAAQWSVSRSVGRVAAHRARRPAGQGVGTRSAP